MAFSVVSWDYQDEVTSEKLAQMVESLRVHDHRSDGTQGAALIGEWITPAGVAANGGWSLSTKRYRLLLGGRIVQYDFVVSRTGGNIDAAAETDSWPGKLNSNTILSGIPAAAITSTQFFATEGSKAGLTCLSKSDGTIETRATTTGGKIATGETLYLRPTLWRA